MAAVTGAGAWVGREPLSNLSSLVPEENIIVWAATHHRVYRRRYAEAARERRWAGVRFTRLRTQGEADRLLAGVASAGTRHGGAKED